jgi:hypothetical protein
MHRRECYWLSVGSMSSVSVFPLGGWPYQFSKGIVSYEGTRGDPADPGDATCASGHSHVNIGSFSRKGGESLAQREGEVV